MNSEIINLKRQAVQMKTAHENALALAEKQLEKARLGVAEEQAKIDVLTQLEKDIEANLPKAAPSEYPSEADTAEERKVPEKKPYSKY